MDSCLASVRPAGVTDLSFNRAVGGLESPHSQVAAVELPKMLRQLQGDEQCTQPHGDSVRRLPQLETANARQQNVGYRQIETSPQDVYRRR